MMLQRNKRATDNADPRHALYFGSERPRGSEDRIRIRKIGFKTKVGIEKQDTGVPDV